MDWHVLRTKLATLGPHQVLGHYAFRGVNRVLPLDLVRAFCVTPADLHAPVVRPWEVRCEQLAAKRLYLEAETGRSLSTSDVDVCLARGEDCFGVFVEDVLASYAWYTSKTARLRPGVNVRFDSRYAYSRWAFTYPDYRGRGLHAMGKRYAVERYAAAGRRGVLSAVSVANFESLNSSRRLGSRPVGLMLAASLDGRLLLWASAGCRSYGLELEADDGANEGPLVSNAQA